MTQNETPLSPRSEAERYLISSFSVANNPSSPRLRRVLLRPYSSKQDSGYSAKENKKIKILIIGAKGMLGQELVKVFESDQAIKRSSDQVIAYDVIAWDREEIDITDEKQTEEKISFLAPDIIINSAAYNAVDEAETKPDMAMRINGYAPGYLAKVSKKIGAVLIHYSTDYVFEGINQDGYAEHDKPEPQNAYANSKFLGEQEVEKYTDKYYIIRLCRLFGQPAQSETAKKSFIDVMLNLSQTRDKLEIVDEEYGNPTYAPDLAKRTKEIIENYLPYGIYHTANEGACTWYEFANEAFKIKKIKIKTIPVSGDKFPRPAKRPKYSSLLNTKLPPMRKWQEALKEYLGDGR